MPHKSLVVRLGDGQFWGKVGFRDPLGPVAAAHSFTFRTEQECTAAAKVAGGTPCWLWWDAKERAWASLPLGMKLCCECGVTIEKPHLPADEGERCEECADETCRTCGDHYDAGGDGFDGECPPCADQTDRRERRHTHELRTSANPFRDPGRE